VDPLASNCGEWPNDTIARPRGHAISSLRMILRKRRLFYTFVLAALRNLSIATGVAVRCNRGLGRIIEGRRDSLRGWIENKVTCKKRTKLLAPTNAHARPCKFHLT
jgi:hypothetical protein